MEKLPIRLSDFTFIGFHLNALLDRGIEEDIEEIREKIDEGNVVNWLWAKYKNDFDMSIFSDRLDDLDSINKFFADISGVNSRKKMGVENNGICLLLAFCLEGLQRI